MEVYSHRQCLALIGYRLVAVEVILLANNNQDNCCSLHVWIESDGFRKCGEGWVRGGRNQAKKKKFVRIISLFWWKMMCNMQWYNTTHQKLWYSYLYPEVYLVLTGLTHLIHQNWHNIHINLAVDMDVYDCLARICEDPVEQNGFPHLLAQLDMAISFAPTLLLPTHEIENMWYDDPISVERHTQVKIIQYSYQSCTTHFQSSHTEATS